MAILKRNQPLRAVQCPVRRSILGLGLAYAFAPALAVAAPSRKKTDFSNANLIRVPNTDYLLEKDSPEFYRGSLRLRLSRPEAGPDFNEIIFDQGRLVDSAYRRLCWLLRDIHVNRAVAIDDRLILILIAMQTYLDSNGYVKPIIVTSAYRSEKTNNKLLGEGASKNSMHLTGQAIDIRIPGLSPSYMSKLAAAFRPSGVGVYSSKNFVHIDTGRFRPDGSMRSWGR